MRLLSSLLSLGLVSVLAACGSSSSSSTTTTPPGADAGTTATDATADGSAVGSAGDAAATDAGKTDSGAKLDVAPKDTGASTGDGDDNINAAVEFDSGATDGVDGQLDPTGDIDFYKFEGKKGQLVTLNLYTSQTLQGINNHDQGDVIIDTILTLYGPDKAEIMYNDDRGDTVGNNDSGITTMLPADGTYYFSVQECQTWINDHPKSGSTCLGDSDKEDVDYKVTVETADPVKHPSYNPEQEPNETTAQATVVKFEKSANPNAKGAYYANLLYGTYSATSDVDVFKITLPKDAPVSMGRATLYIEGDQAGSNGAGNGSTAGPGIATLSSDATPVIATADLAKASLGVPVVLGETYYLTLKHDSAKPGAFDFYVITQSQGGSNPVEKADATNDSKDAAEVLSYEKNTTYKGFYVAGNIGNGGKDVDWYSLTVGSDATGNDFNLYCFTSGSGVQGLNVELTEADGTPVVGFKATQADGSVKSTGTKVKASSKYLVKVSASGQSSTVASDHYTCAFIFQPPQQ
jgi:hypothetical protein